MRNATAKLDRLLSTDTGKKAWRKPQIRSISLSENFDPSSGLTREQWAAALQLKARADKTVRQRHPGK